MASRIAAAVTKNKSDEWLGNIGVWSRGVWLQAFEFESGSSGREEDRRAFRDDDGVLVVSGEAAVSRADGPAIAVEGYAAGACGDDGLDRDHQAVGEEVARFGVGVIGDAGFFVDGATYTVAAEFADDVEATAANFALDGAPDVFGAVADAGSAEGLAERALSALG